MRVSEFGSFDFDEWIRQAPDEVKVQMAKTHKAACVVRQAAQKVDAAKKEYDSAQADLYRAEQSLDEETRELSKILNNEAKSLAPSPEGPQ